MEGLTPKEADAWASEMTRIVGGTIHELINTILTVIPLFSIIPTCFRLWQVWQPLNTMKWVVGPMARDEVWDALKNHAKQVHSERVAKNPDRIAYAIQQFEAHGIEYQLKNEQTGHFHCWRKSDDKLFQFYAGTGKIQGFTQVRGIHSLIQMLEG